MSSGAGSTRGFRRRRAADVSSYHFGPNMTPMVDVVMVILVFFMASAAFLGPEWLLSGLVPQKPAAAGQSNPLNNPGAGPSSGDPFATAPVRFVIELSIKGDSGGVVRATGAGVQDGTIEEVVQSLVASVGNAKDQVEVLIRPGTGVAWGAVVRVHELCTQAGILRVGPES
jgi:biopolymer transport protein ExbD